MALILTTPISSSTGQGIPPIISDTVIVQTISVVDTVDITVHSSIKWIVVITDTSSTLQLTQEVLASYNGMIKYNRSSLVGDLLPHSILVDIDSNHTEMRLHVGNPTTNLYNIRIYRLIF
jgi:hypothetical protein